MDFGLQMRVMTGGPFSLDANSHWTVTNETLLSYYSFFDSS